ncbi:MAG: NEW3 domain-containing protein [Bacteroidota bacterium]
MNIKRIAPLLFLLLLGLTGVGDLMAQSPFPNARDDNYPLLGLKRAKSSYDRAQGEFIRQQELFEKQLISLEQYENARNTFLDAEVNYQQSLLVLLFEQQFVSIAKAIKSQQESGAKQVTVTLANTTGASSEFAQIAGVEDEIFRSLQPDVIHNVYVSLSNDEGAIISSPYEVKLDELRSGNPESVTFDLLQDLDEVTVNLIYGNGASRSPKIFLEKDASANKVLLQSEQFSQEVELGESTVFGLSMELFSGVDNTYKLEVVNLPRSVTRNFSEQGSEARVSQIRFTESSNTRRANLNVSLPDRPSDDVTMDESVEFYVMAIPRDRLAEFNERRTEQWTEEEVEAFNVGYVRLEMIPRGVGRLTVKAPQLFSSANQDEPIVFTFKVLNEGSRRVDNIEFELDTPLRWEQKVEPALIPSLGIREEQTVTLTLTPPENLSVGRYETRMRTTALSDNQPIQGEDKTFTVQSEAEASLFGTSLILLIIIALVGGLVFFGIKLSKK